MLRDCNSWGVHMSVTTEDLEGGVTRVILDGRLDIVGGAAVEPPMNLIGESKNAVLVDLQKVIFIGSVGLRALFGPVQAIKSRGGRIVLFGPNEMVEKVLKTSGIDTIVPIHHELQSALAALRA